MTKIGRPSPWQGETAMTRLPAALIPTLKEIAHKLEAGETVVYGKELEAAIDERVQDAIAECLRTMRPKDRRGALRLYKKLITVLQS